MALTPEQEAAYALDYGVDRKDLPKAAQAEYDKLKQERYLASPHAAAQPKHAAASHIGTQQARGTPISYGGYFGPAGILGGLVLIIAHAVIPHVWTVTGSDGFGDTVSASMATAHAICSTGLAQTFVAQQCTTPNAVYSVMTFLFWIGLLMIISGFFGVTHAVSAFQAAQKPAGK